MIDDVVIGDDVELPDLDPEVVADDELLADAADRVALDHDRRAQEELGLHAAWLREALPPDLVQLFLRHGELANARSAALIVLIARWGFEQGRRFPLKAEASK